MGAKSSKQNGTRIRKKCIRIEFSEAGLKLAFDAATRRRRSEPTGRYVGARLYAAILADAVEDYHGHLGTPWSRSLEQEVADNCRSGCNVNGTAALVRLECSSKFAKIGAEIGSLVQKTTRIHITGVFEIDRRILNYVPDLIEGEAQEISRLVERASSIVFPPRISSSEYKGRRNLQGLAEQLASWGARNERTLRCSGCTKEIEEKIEEVLGPS